MNGRKGEPGLPVRHRLAIACFAFAVPLNDALSLVLGVRRPDGDDW